MGGLGGPGASAAQEKATARAAKTVTIVRNSGKSLISQLVSVIAISPFAPRRVERRRERPRSPCLNRLEIQRCRLLIGGTLVVRETLADRRNHVLGPGKRAALKREHVAAGLLFDFTVTGCGIERLDGSKILHGFVPCLARVGSDALPLGDVKDGGRCGLAPKTVDFDW